MTLPTSGKLKLSQIQAEFGGSAPTKLSEYYAGGAYVPSGTTGTYGAVPSSGKITIKNFYGTTNRAFPAYTFSSSTANASLNVTSISGYIAGISDITITVNSGVYLYATSNSNAGLTLTGGTSGDTITIVNNGFIMGQGGSGTVYDGAGNITTAATTGGPALSLGFNTTVNNTNASAYIGGGGGAGGDSFPWAGSGGGAGGGNATQYDGFWTSGAGGGIGASGANGGGSGGQGGGGGRIFPGTGGAGATAVSGAGSIDASGGGAGGGGAAANLSGKPDLQLGNGGGGGWGASGGSSYFISGTTLTAYGGAGGSANNAGADGSVSGGTFNVAGTAGGKAVALNGYSITWTSGNTTRVYGAVS